MTHLAITSLKLAGTFSALLHRAVTGFTLYSHHGVRMRGVLTRSGSARRCLPESRYHFLGGLAGGAVVLAFPLAVRADPPLEKFNKDEICLKRNLNGSCKTSGIGDSDNVQEVVDTSKETAQEDPENELIAKLKKRTQENKARNEEEIATKTFVNGQSGEFGPFSRYVTVKHRDTGKYELVLAGELEEMRRSGLVVKERGQDVFTDAQQTK